MGNMVNAKHDKPTQENRRQRRAAEREAAAKAKAMAKAKAAAKAAAKPAAKAKVMASPPAIPALTGPAMPGKGGGKGMWTAGGVHIPTSSWILLLEVASEIGAGGSSGSNDPLCGTVRGSLRPERL